MSSRPRQMLEHIRQELALGERENRLVPAIADGSAPLAVLAELAAQQHRIIASDRRSLLVPAARCADGPAGDYFAGFAEGESRALRSLDAFAARTGLSPHELLARRPLPGCQAYPSYLAWLALNGDPAGVVLALTANFALWGGYCATVGQALRRHYGFPDEACAFFDFFAQPATALEQKAADALGPDPLDGPALAAAREYALLLQAYEHLFWDTLAASAAD
ncbi:transcriptional regulator [Kitasatospora aureofaciens]|uniref:transcriptional regulator n=1 Tax=Kitasatospora aureofaciens TaxID=1894 RepID=UPI001C47C6D0|nr:transcriptional regulator [Kitasatospora aureofaciens]MBV6699127.1 transcriptional regulator [Kitasatospora aureofaciens]